VDTLSEYVGAMPRMVRDITTRALRDLGAGVVDAPPDPAALRAQAGGRPPILVVATRGQELRTYERDVLAARPDAVVVVLDEQGRSIARYELWPQRLARGELSVAAIETAVRTATSWHDRFRG
jgi:hypothetical protein